MLDFKLSKVLEEITGLFLVIIPGINSIDPHYLLRIL
jgi:hypothetical protein